MKIAIIGTRGIPAAYGGFETFAEELSTRLVRRGHEVWVYCRAHAVHERLAEYHGVRLRFVPAIRHKYLDTVSHTFLSVLHLLVRGPLVDVVLVCNAANSAFCCLTRAAGIGTVLNVDGVERRRKKWNSLGRAWYRMSERLATWLPAAIVTDARAIQSYYLERYGKQSRFIPYGASPPGAAGTDRLQRLGLRPGNYVLYVSRLEPENNALLVVRAFEKVRGNVSLAVVGDAPYAAGYIRRLHDTSDRRILFPGAVYGEGYRQLRAHALLYVHATEVGGTHPALIEAMAAARPVLYLDTIENREAAADSGLAFSSSPDDLAAKMQFLLDCPEERQRLAALASERARRLYDWEEITTAYEELFREINHGSRRAGRIDTDGRRSA